MKYDYLAALEADIKDWCNYEHFDLSDYVDIDEAHEYLHDTLWDDSSITGNGSDWYGTVEECEECLCGNWDFVLEAIDNFCIDVNEELACYKKKFPQFLDCITRLNLLDLAIENVLEDFVNGIK